MCVVGSEDLTFAFSSLGFKPFVAESREDVLKILHLLNDYDIVLIQENAAESVKREIDDLKMIGKVFIEVPGLSGSEGYTRGRLRKMVVNAVGMDIFRE